MTHQFNRQYILLISSIAALGGVLFGFDTAIISGTISFIKQYFQLDEVMLGWAVSCILIGCGLGALLAGKTADRLGRQRTMLICAVLFAATGIGAGLAQSLIVFIAFRIAGGLAVGAAAMVVPMYIAETVPAILRGRMVSLYQLAITAGILLAYLINYLLTGTGPDSWRWMFILQAVPAALFFFALFFVPETPRWLIQNGFTEKAFKVLAHTGGTDYAAIEQTAIENNFAHVSTGRLKDLFASTNRRVILIGIVIAIFQQITGINAILYYAPEIFKNTGVSAGSASVQTVGIGIIMMLATVVAIVLVDKVGRKQIMLTGCALMGVTLLGVAACFYFRFFDYYLVLIFLMLYIISFSCSLGAVTWVILSEIFPNHIRSLALALATLILWLADFAASFSFPIMNQHFGMATTLLIFTFCCLIYLIYIKYKIPETKGKTLEELETLLIK